MQELRNKPINEIVEKKLCQKTIRQKEISHLRNNSNIATSSYRLHKKAWFKFNIFFRAS